MLANGGADVFSPLLELPEPELPVAELPGLAPADALLADFDEPDEAWAAVAWAGPGSV